MNSNALIPGLAWTLRPATAVGFRHYSPPGCLWLQLVPCLVIPCLGGHSFDGAGPMNLPGEFTFSLPISSPSFLILLLLFAIFRRRPKGLVPDDVSAATGDLVCMLGSDGRLLHAAGRFRKAIGLNEHDSVKGIHVSDFVVESKNIFEFLKNGAVEKREGPFNVQYRNRDGSVFPVSVSVVKLNPAGRLPGFLLVARDLSETRNLARKNGESVEEYRQIVDNSPDGIVVIQEGRLVFANPSAVRIFGYATVEDMTTLSFQDIVAPGSKPFLMQDFGQRKIGESIFTNYEMKGLTKQGHVIDLELSAKVVSWSGDTAMLASFRDITERKELERGQALWFWEQEMLMTIDRQLVAMVDLEKALDAVSQHARAFTRADFSGMLMVREDERTYMWRGIRGNLQPLPQRSFPILEAHRNLFKAGGPIIVRDLGRESGTNQFPVLVQERVETCAVFPFRLGAGRYGLLVVGFRGRHDFSDREMRLLSSLAEKSAIALTNAELYEDLRLREKELEQLSRARSAAQEEERRRIARELHDGLGQMITAAKFTVEMLEDSSGLSEADKRKTDEIKGLLDKVMTEVREISYDLMPSVLEDFGLSPAIQLLCDTVSRRMQMDVSFQAHGVQGRFEPSIEINLYRIAQEALTNVLKHAEARRVDIQIVRHEGIIRMTIEDDGKGFVVGTGQSGMGARGGIGLVSMRERVAAFGGTFHIESDPGQGTTIIIEVPHYETGAKADQNPSGR